MGKFMVNDRKKIALLLDKLFMGETIVVIASKVTISSQRAHCLVSGEWDKLLQLKCQSKVTICCNPILLKVRIGLQPCVVYCNVVFESCLQTTTLYKLKYSIKHCVLYCWVSMLHHQPD